MRNILGILIANYFGGSGGSNRVYMARHSSTLHTVYWAVIKIPLYTNEATWYVWRTRVVKSEARCKISFKIIPLKKKENHFNTWNSKIYRLIEMEMHVLCFTDTNDSIVITKATCTQHFWMKKGEIYVCNWPFSSNILPLFGCTYQKSVEFRIISRLNWEREKREKWTLSPSILRIRFQF